MLFGKGSELGGLLGSKDFLLFLAFPLKTEHLKQAVVNASKRSYNRMLYGPLGNPDSLKSTAKRHSWDNWENINMDWVLDYINERFFILLSVIKTWWSYALTYSFVIHTWVFLGEMVTGICFKIFQEKKREVVEVSDMEWTMLITETALSSIAYVWTFFLWKQKEKWARIANRRT